MEKISRLRFYSNLLFSPSDFFCTTYAIATGPLRERLKQRCRETYFFLLPYLAGSFVLVLLFLGLGWSLWANLFSMYLFASIGIITLYLALALYYYLSRLLSFYLGKNFTLIAVKRARGTITIQQAEDLTLYLGARSLLLSSCLGLFLAIVLYGFGSVVPSTAAPFTSAPMHIIMHLAITTYTSYHLIPKVTGANWWFYMVWVIFFTIVEYFAQLAVLALTGLLLWSLAAVLLKTPLLLSGLKALLFYVS